MEDNRNAAADLLRQLDEYEAGCLQLIGRDDDDRPTFGIFVTRSPELVEGFASLESAWSDEDGPLGEVPEDMLRRLVSSPGIAFRFIAEVHRWINEHGPEEPPTGFGDFFRQWYLVTGEHAVLGEYGWEPGDHYLQHPGEFDPEVFSDEVNAPQGRALLGTNDAEAEGTS